MRGFAAFARLLVLLCCLCALASAETCICDDSGDLTPGLCEDSGPGSARSTSELGRDCTDCGPSNRLSLQPGAGCADTTWLTAYNCADGVVDPVTNVCYCSSPAASAADNCTEVGESCGAPCIEGTESCCEANSVLVRVVGYDRQQIAANDPVRGTYMLFTEESDKLSAEGTDHPQIEALADGSLVYAHGDVLEHFSADGTHIGAIAIDAPGLVISCVRCLNEELLLVCDANSASILLTRMVSVGETFEAQILHQLTVQESGVDVEVDPFDLAVLYDEGSQAYNLFLLARDDATSDTAVFGGTLLDSDIDSWVELPSNETSALDKLFDITWTTQSYGLEVAPDGSLLIASRDPQYSVMRYTPSGTNLGIFFSGETLSNEIHHIRRSTRGLYYLTDTQSRSQVLVLGSNGEFQGYVEPQTGYLAEPRYLALPSGPYTAYCSVSDMPDLIVAGTDINVTITIRDQDQKLWDNPVEISAVLGGHAISNNKLYTLGQDLSDDVVDGGNGVYTLRLQPRLASLMYPNETGEFLYDPQLISYMDANGIAEVDYEDFKYQLTIAITSYGFVLRTQSYAVSAANTSALGTMLDDAHALGFAGFPGELVITARDQYGNPKLQGGEASQFTSVVIDGRQDTQFTSEIVDNGDGTYALTYLAFIAGTQLVEIRYAGQQIVHSPVAMAIAAGELNISTSFLYAQGVHYFDIGTSEVNLVFFQPRDTYGNLIPFRRSIATSNFTLEIEVPHSKFSARLGNVSYTLDGTYRTGYQIYMSSDDSDVSLYEQNKMLERIILTATYNGELLSTLVDTSPFVVPNHKQYRDEDFDLGLKVAGLCIAAVGMALAISYAIGAWLLRNHQVFKFGNSTLLLLMCVGTALVCAAPLLYGGQSEPTDEACIGGFWLFHVGCAVMLSALLARTRRLSALMQGSRVLKPAALADRTRVVILGPVGCTLIYMMLWTVTIPPKVDTLVAKENTSVDGVVTKYQQKTCSPGSLGWNYPILCIELLLLAYSMLLAYETRKLNRALMDGKQMSYVLYNFLFWAVVGFVLFFALQLQSTEPAVAFFVLSITCFMSFVVSLSILLLPKFVKAMVDRERRLTLSDFLKPRAQYEGEGQPREDSTVELKKPPLTPEAVDVGEDGENNQSQDFL